MDPKKLKLPQLRKALQERQLSTKGRKVELILRMQEADPTGAWIEEAAQYTAGGEESELALDAEVESETEEGSESPIQGQELEERQTEAH